MLHGFQIGKAHVDGSETDVGNRIQRLQPFQYILADLLRGHLRLAQVEEMLFHLANEDVDILLGTGRFSSALSVLRMSLSREYGSRRPSFFATISGTASARS